MTIDVDRPDFTVGQESELWAGHTLHELYEIAHTPWEWHKRCSNGRRLAASNVCPHHSTSPRSISWNRSMPLPTRWRRSRALTMHW